MHSSAQPSADIALTFTSDTSKLINIWKQLPGDYWNENDIAKFLPAYLTDTAKASARKELQAIPERFYNALKLPVITPDNCKMFLELIPAFKFALWSWFSGSSYLALVMLRVPHSMCVLFPIDLRYGWDIANPAHQKLLLACDSKFQPAVTMAEPQLKHTKPRNHKV